jgi:WD40 repeat protein
MSSHARLQYFIRPILRYLTVSALLLFLSTSIHAAQEVILRLDPGGHTAKFGGLLITPGGKLVTASFDKTIRVWNPKTGREERKILGQIGAGNEGLIFSIALSPDGKLLASGGFFLPNHKIRLYDFQTGEQLQTLKGHENVVQDLAFSPDGRWLASGSNDKTVRLWKRSGSRFSAGPVLRGHEKQVYAVRLFEDGGRLRMVSASLDHTVRLWDAESGRQLALGRHEEKAHSLAVGPDWIASSGFDKTIRIWDYSLRPLRTIHSETWPFGLAAHPDGNRLLVGRGSLPNKVNIWNIRTSELITSFTGHKNLIKVMGWLPDGTAVSAGGSNKEIVFWDADTGREQRRIVGSGRNVWSSGLKGPQLGFGNTWERPVVENANPLQHAFDFTSLQVTKLSKKDASSFQRLKTHFGPLKLSHEKGGDYGDKSAVLVIKEGSRERARVVRDGSNGYGHNVYGFTRDGNIVSGGSHGYLAVYDKDGEELANLIGHEGDVWALAIEGDRLLSGSGDQTLKLWDLGQVGSKQTIEHTLSLFVSFEKGSNPPEPSEWVAWTKSGYYTSSLNGDRLIGFHVNRGTEKAADFYDSTRFYEKLYRPDIVRLAYQLGDEEAAIAEASKKRRTEKIEVAAILPPKVRIVSPADGSSVSGGEVAVRFTVELPQGAPADTPVKIIVKINGRNIDAGQRGIKRVEDTPDSGRIRQFTRSIPLEPGENVLEVLAKTSASSSNPATISITRKAPKKADPFRPNLYVLAIGVSDYERDELDLRFAHADAEAIARAFKTQQGRLFGEVKTKVLTDSQATKGEVLDGFDWIESEVTQRDVAVVFVAGHGTNDKRDNYYFLPHDANPEKLRRSGVKWSEFNSILQELPGKTMLLADTCKSGNVTGSLKTRGISSSDATSALMELIRAESGVVVMSASTGSEVSIEDPAWGHGAFTKALLDGLDGPADYDRNGVITLKELDLHITRSVKKLTNGSQRPTTQIPENMPDFPLFLR